jgi:hypothetical protein
MLWLSELHPYHTCWAVVVAAAVRVATGVCWPGRSNWMDKDGDTLIPFVSPVAQVCFVGAGGEANNRVPSSCLTHVVRVL